MRIISGEMRGRVIEAPAGDATRPTSDRVREALMSSLGSLRGGLDGAVVLDAFAGSGALGLEALSRGARFALFFERDHKALSVLERNVVKCRVGAERARIVGRDVESARLRTPAGPIDLVFLDPPYAFDPARVLALVSRGIGEGGVDPRAIVVYEHAAKDAARVADAAGAAGFDIVAVKKYGKTGVTIVRQARPLP